MKNYNSKLLNIKYPIIQGGMGVGVSLSSLAGSVAKNGAMGVISTANIGFKNKEFFSDPVKYNLIALKEEVEKAREIAKGNGLVAVNIMTVINDYTNLVKASIKNGVDAIISGAGLPLNLAELVKGSQVMIAPIISSARACEIIIRRWLKTSDRLPDFVVVEGKGAGGHLGFSKDTLNSEEFNLENILKETLNIVKKYEEKYNTKIPVFAGGSVFDGADIKKYMDLGAFGVQIGTRFIATHECDADINFKNTIINAKEEDLKIVESPVGMPGRVVYTDLFEKLDKEGRIPPKRCIDCIKTCNPATTKYCITQALIDAANGVRESGLFFSGENVGKINELISVDELIDELVTEGGLK